MKKSQVLLLIAAAVFVIVMIPVFSAVPQGTTNAMYATGYTSGPVVSVQLPSANIARLDPANALGTYDAIQTDGVAANTHFYAVASRSWTKYTFDHDLWNVTGVPDISFCEVTWGATWHTEAVKVYLTGAYVYDNNHNIVPYAGDDSTLNLTAASGGTESTYYAGIAWNKVGINNLSAATRNTITQSYAPEGIYRAFEANTYSQDGNFGWARFYLPNDVVYATGIVLVDITGNVYNLAGTPSTYTGNTDGYDLDAIRVYRYIPWRTGDSATGCTDPSTGLGSKILSKGTWFMYNAFSGTSMTYPIQAGNPKDGVNIIGSYTITKTGANTFTATYDIDPTVMMNGYAYDIAVTAEHLSISDTQSFTAKPGQDDNQNFGESFTDTDGKFFVFAHFAVEYK